MSYIRKLIIISCLAIIFASGCAVNPITGKTELMLLSPDQDIEIGQAYAPEIKEQLGGPIDDHQLQQYINRVGQSVAATSHRPEMPYEFTAVNEESLNALALPGGPIFITKGMLLQLETEDQLAGILAHEVAHVVARHGAAQMSRQIGMDIVLSAVVRDEAPRGAMTVAQVGRQIINLSYSRDQERQSDIAGIDYMVEAGYNPYGMQQVMEMLEQAAGVRSIEFLSTHPSPENRVQYINARIRERYPQFDNVRTRTQDYNRNVLDRLN